MPAFRALRAGLPEATITLVGLPGARAFVERFAHLLDDLVPLPGYPGLPEQNLDPRALLTFLDQAQGRFDLAIQMQGSGLISNPLVRLLDASLTAGFYLPGQYCPDPERFLPYPAHEREVRRHLALVEFLGLPAQGEGLEFPLRDEDFESLETVPSAAKLRQDDYVCIHPGARSPARRWAPERFAEVGDALSRRGLRIVLTGSSDEAELTNEVGGRMTAPSMDLAGQTELGALAALLANARLLVSNDTGISHLAEALNVPSVIVFTQSDPERWAPLPSDAHRAVIGPSVENNPCRHIDGPQVHRCLRDGCTAPARLLEEIDRAGIPAHAVLRQAYDLLGISDAYHLPFPS